jgi:uroporphyrinogen-III synthase
MPTLLLTRPVDASERFAAMLRDRLGPVPVIMAPLIGIAIGPRPVLPPGADYILTSAHAVAAILHHDLPRRRAWAVGDQTAAAARAAGLDVQSAAGDATALIDLILAQNTLGPLVHLHGEHTRGDVAGRLTAAGIPTQGVVAYRQPETGLPDALRDLTGAIVAPVFSPRTATLLARQWSAPGPLLLAAMSQAVAAPLRELPHAALVVATAPDARAMADVVAELWQKAQVLEAGAGGA